jgi:hypothetical protein
MRTKAEALANPMAGDRWKIETHDWPWSDLTVIGVLSTGEVHGRYADATATVMSCFGFQAYCVNAEYLGGVDRRWLTLRAIERRKDRIK